MGSEETFFEYAAEAGLTKHIGGVAATDLLAGLCNVDSNSYLLDVGCGVGVTPCYLAQKYGCRVMGVDIIEKMVTRSRERVEKLGLEERVAFRTADAQELPFEDNTFDAVITESVTALTADQLQAVTEYTRVAKRQGYVGLNETTWLKTPPPPEVVAWTAQDVGADIQPLSAVGWKQLLENAGLVEIVVHSWAIDTKTEAKGILQRYGLGGILGSMWRGLRMYMRNPSYRQFVKGVNTRGITPPNLEEYFGYGIYVGRKPS